MGRYFNEEEIQITRAVIANYEKRVAELEKINAALVKVLKAIVKAEREFWRDAGVRSEMDDPLNEVIKEARAAIALAKQPDIDPVTKLPFNRDEPYCGECNRPAANCDCGEF